MNFLNLLEIYKENGHNLITSFDFDRVKCLLKVSRDFHNEARVKRNIDFVGFVDWNFPPAIETAEQKGDQHDLRLDHNLHPGAVLLLLDNGPMLPE